jgi:hypothetical protein
MAAAMDILSADGFRLYVYLCLNAERQAGRLAWEPDEVTRVFRCPSQHVGAAMEELCRQQVCTREENSDGATVEIGDRFWPYEKTAAREDRPDQTSYVEQVRQMMLRPACVRASFSAADERLAVNFYRRGITLEQIQRAIWLGCARKYIALLNRQTPILITSLYYFSATVNEVIETGVGDGYWSHVRHKAEQLERRWVVSRSHNPSSERDEMMETK